MRKERKRINFTLTQLYQAIGISKQAHWKYIKRDLSNKENKEIVLQNMLAVRMLHPKIGAKKMYKILQPKDFGRDNFINIYKEAGLSVIKHKNYRRTTFSNPAMRYQNHVVNLSINNINQLWTSDITYLEIGERKFLYIVFIMDVYSRRILGYNVSENLSAKSNIIALKMSLKLRKIKSYTNLIHHSDRGVQYTSIKYTELLHNYNIKISMCQSVYENTHIERVNGIIKNEYLSNFKIQTIQQCQLTLKKSVYLYNNQRPHWSINLKPPTEYENELEKIPQSEKINYKIFSMNNCPNNPNFKQGELFFSEIND